MSSNKLLWGYLLWNYRMHKNAELESASYKILVNRISSPCFSLRSPRSAFWLASFSIRLGVISLIKRWKKTREAGRTLKILFLLKKNCVIPLFSPYLWKTWSIPSFLKAGFYVNLSEIWKFKKGLKVKKKFWNTTRQLIAPERAPQVGWQLFSAHLPIFNFKF